MTEFDEALEAADRALDRWCGPTWKGRLAVRALRRSGMLMDTVSEEHLALVNPILSAKVHAAAACLAAGGRFFRVASGLRTYAQQDALYAQGRTGPGARVTNAKAGYSNHNFGCAVDCYPFLNGPSGALDLTDPNSVEFESMVNALKAQGLSWGGDWKSICDRPHFQLAQVPVTPTDEDRAAFAVGGLPAVWALYVEA